MQELRSLPSVSLQNKQMYSLHSRYLAAPTKFSYSQMVTEPANQQIAPPLKTGEKVIPQKNEKVDLLPVGRS